MSTTQSYLLKIVKLMDPTVGQGLSPLHLVFLKFIGEFRRRFNTYSPYGHISPAQESRPLIFIGMSIGYHDMYLVPHTTLIVSLKRYINKMF